MDSFPGTLSCHSPPDAVVPQHAFGWVRLPRTVIPETLHLCLIQRQPAQAQPRVLKASLVDIARGQLGRSPTPALPRDLWGVGTAAEQVPGSSQAWPLRPWGWG